MRQVHLAGEKLFIDYSGDTVEVIDAASGEIRQAQIFVAVLGASKYTYAEASWTQTLPDWIASHIRCLEFLGAVPALFVPDNQKKLRARIGRLLSGAAAVEVGGMTETELKTRKELAERTADTLRAAVKGGVVRGGGVALLGCRKVLEHGR